MYLRNPLEMAVWEVDDSYVLDLEDEVRKLRRISRAHRKSMRDMQRVLENRNLKMMIVRLWSKYKDEQKVDK